MQMSNPFMLHESEYTRKQNIIARWMEAGSIYCSRLTNTDQSQAKDYIRGNFGDNKKYKIASPELQYAYSESRGNKVLGETTLWEYAKDVIDKDYLMAPSMTAYYPLEDKVTLTVPFLKEQSDRRNILKKIKLDALADKDFHKADSADAGQNTVKRYMNSVSGAYTVVSTTLFNFSGHSSLTSTCRVGTSYANSSNERFLGGLRHYHCVDVVVAAVVAVTQYAPLKETAEVMAKYKLHYPTVEETMAVIERSANRYFRSTNGMKQIRTIVDVMTPDERASLVYTSDLYHLEIYNPEFARWLLREPAAAPKHQVTSYEEAKAIFKSTDSETLFLARYLCGDALKGVKWSDAESLEKHTQTYFKAASIAKHVSEFMSEISDYINAFLIPRVLPQSIYKIPSARRRSAIYSDTDSTLSTGQHQVKLISPDNLFSKEGWETGYITSYYACQQLPHLHAMMSANLGIKGKDRFTFQMKNEFYIPLMGLTGRVKHYYYWASSQEGTIFDEFDTVMKGVSLRGITSSELVKQKFEEYVKMTLEKIMYEGGLTAEEAMQPVLDVYYAIVDDIRKSGYNYLRSTEVKDTEAYTKKDQDVNVKNRRLWDEVFTPNYQPSPEPPYQSLNLSIEIRNKAKLEQWVDGMADKDLGARMKEFVTREMGGSITTIRIPEQSISEKGIPEELLSVLDLRKLTTSIMLPFYIVLESLGIYFMNEKLTRIISDEWVGIQNR